MKRTHHMMAMLAIGLAACSSAGSADTTTATADTSTTSQPAAAEACPREGEVLDTAKVYIEHNATDEDTGVHGLFGGEAWSELCIWDPNGELVFFVDPQGSLNDLRVADFFFESREPPNDEYTIDDLRAAFPEGEYVAGGTDFEGVARVARAVFTHDIPAEPEITSPPLSDEESLEDATVPAAGLMVTWEPVTETIFGDPVTIVGYEVILTKVDHDDPNALSRPVYDVHVGSDATALAVPDSFVEAGTIYELEVLALEESGNQTIGLGFFQTADEAEASELSDALLAIEFNSESQDYSFQLELDADPWAVLGVVDPDGKPIFSVANAGGLADQGLTSLLFESAEPTVDELPLAEFLARFPEGEYRFSGWTVEGDALAGNAEFSHDIPDAPVIVSPPVAATVDRGTTVRIRPRLASGEAL